MLLSVVGALINDQLIGKENSVDSVTKIEPRSLAFFDQITRKINTWFPLHLLLRSYINT